MAVGAFQSAQMVTGIRLEVDSGILQVNERGDDQYFAVSEQFDDVFYPITLAEPGAMYWGYTNKYYERSE